MRPIIWVCRRYRRCRRSLPRLSCSSLSTLTANSLTITSDSSSATFYERSIDAETGEWGTSSEFYSVADNNNGIDGDEVRLSSRSINDLNVLNTQTSVQIYPPAGGETPLIDCTSTMLAVCGEASQFWQDISGQYLLLLVNGNMEIVRVDLANKQIVDTGNSIDQTPSFSPDDAILYGTAFGPGSYVQIYRFNESTGGSLWAAKLRSPQLCGTFFRRCENSGSNVCHTGWCAKIRVQDRAS